MSEFNTPRIERHEGEPSLNLSPLLDDFFPKHEAYFNTSKIDAPGLLKRAASELIPELETTKRSDRRGLLPFAVNALRGLRVPKIDLSSAQLHVAKSETLSDESWDSFTVEKRWIEGTILKDGQPVPLDHAYAYLVTRYAWDINGARNTGQSIEDFYLKFNVSANGPTRMSGKRYLDNKSPEDALAEILVKFEDRYKTTS